MDLKSYFEQDIKKDGRKLRKKARTPNKIFKLNSRKLIALAKKENDLIDFFNRFESNYSLESDKTKIEVIFVQREIKGIKQLKALDSFSHDIIKEINAVYRYSDKQTILIDLSRTRCPKCSRTFKGLFDFILHWVVSHPETTMKFFTKKKSKENPSKVLYLALEPDYNHTSFPSTGHISTYKRRDKDKKGFQLKLLKAKIQRIFCEERVTNLVFTQIKRWKTQPPNHELIARAGNLQISSTDGMQLVHSKPHGLPYKPDRDDFLEEACESEDHNISEIDHMAQEFKIICMEDPVIPALLKICYNKILKEVDNEISSFDSSFSLHDLNPFFAKRREKICIFEFVEKFSRLREFHSSIYSMLVVFLVKGVIDIEEFYHLNSRNF